MHFVGLNNNLLCFGSGTHAERPNTPAGLPTADRAALLYYQETDTGAQFVWEWPRLAWLNIPLGVSGGGGSDDDSSYVALPPDPWTPHSASDWYASGGVTPPSWTLDSGLSVAYPGHGFGIITQPNDTTERVLLAPLPGADNFHLLARIGIVNASDGGWNMWLGLTAGSTRADICGLEMNPNGSIQPYQNGDTIGFGGNLRAGAGGAPQLVYLWISVVAGVVTVRTSADGRTYASWGSSATEVVPANAIIVLVPQVAETGEDFVLFDFIALGNTTPAGQ